MSRSLVQLLPPPSPRSGQITVDEYHQMLEAGILHDADPIELLDGLLVHKDRSGRGEDPLSIGKEHNLAVQGLVHLNPGLGVRGCHMQIQGPLSLPPHDEPEPDGAILRGLPRDYADRLPGAADVLCVLEVADSSLLQDRTRKMNLYARFGIPQYVLVNLVDARLEVFERPVLAEGRYASSQLLEGPDRVLLLVADGGRLELPARELLP
ncbi:MAG: Uma2 family endonuclease [Planctomycetes bacterium]|nr:Uma2 family endonuclease [Planctomycetota bacterium]